MNEQNKFIHKYFPYKLDGLQGENTLMRKSVTEKYKAFGME